MTQEHKDLLLKDLCARLPYGVKVLYENEIFELEYVCPMYEEVKLDNHESWTIGIDEVKPYLFPLSSMTEEQKEELDKYLDMDSKSLIDGYKNGLNCAHPYFNVQDWYNKNNFDYRGLIPMGLANDATGLNIY